MLRGLGARSHTHPSSSSVRIHSPLPLSARSSGALVRSSVVVAALWRSSPRGTMGNKPKLTCERCSTTFKRQTNGSLRFCKPCRAAAGADFLETDEQGVVIGFSNAIDGAIGEKRTLEGVMGARGGKSGGGGGGKTKKKAKKRARGGPSVSSDPRCLEILEALDAMCVVIDDASDVTAIQKCAEALRKADVIAVDCEGVLMSRTGPVTLLQCATREAVYLIDVQALGARAFDERGAGGILDVLESREAPLKLMFDCRMDSDALFHQFGVCLENVADVQLLDLASRRSLGIMVDRVAGIAKCTDKHLTEAETAVAADLKARVKKMYAVEESKLWAERPMSEDMRRYACLDVWLLIKLYEKIKFDLRDDKDDWIARAMKESARRVLEFRELEVAMQQGVFTEESTVAPTF